MSPLRVNAQEEPWYPLAQQALELYVDGEEDSGLDVTYRIYREHDWQGLQSTFQIWIDEAMRSRGIRPGTVIHPVWKHVKREELTDADGTPEEARWAGRMLAARSALDFDQWTALLDSMPENVDGCVQAMLMICAMQIRGSRDE